MAKFQKNLFGFSDMNPNFKGNPELGHQNTSGSKSFCQKNTMPFRTISCWPQRRMAVAPGGWKMFNIRTKL
jgi:hypothetical protein